MRTDTITTVIAVIIMSAVPFILTPLLTFLILWLFLNPVGFWEKTIWFIMSFLISVFFGKIYFLVLAVID